MGAAFEGNDSLVLKLASGNDAQFSAAAKQKVNAFEKFYLEEVEEEFASSKKILEEADLSDFTDGTLIALALTISDLNTNFYNCDNEFIACDQCDKKLSEFRDVDNDCKLGNLEYGLYAQDISTLPINFSEFNLQRQNEIMKERLNLISKSRKTDNIVNQFLWYNNYDLNQSFLVDFETKNDKALIEAVKLRFNLALVTDFLTNDVRSFKEYNDQFKEELIDDFGTSFAFNTVGDEFLQYRYPRFVEHKIDGFNLNLNCSISDFQNEAAMKSCLEKDFENVLVQTNYETYLMSYLYSNQSNCYVSGGNASKLLNVPNSKFYLLENRSLVPIDSNDGKIECRISKNFAKVNITLSDRLPETQLNAYLDLGYEPRLNLNFEVIEIPGINRYHLFSFEQTNLTDVYLNKIKLNTNDLSYFDTQITDDILFIEDDYIILNDRNRLDDMKTYFNLNDRKFYFLVDTFDFQISDFSTNEYEVRGLYNKRIAFEKNYTLNYNPGFPQYIESQYLGYQNGAHQFKLEVDDNSLDRVTKLSNFNIYFASDLLEFYEGFSYISQKQQIPKSEIFELITEDENLKSYAFVAGENKYAKLNIPPNLN